MPNETAINSIRRPLTFYYIGRPASLYIEALARRRRTRPRLVPDPGPPVEQTPSSMTGLHPDEDLRDSELPVEDERVA
jgi:hypothetical protein